MNDARGAILARIAAAHGRRTCTDTPTEVSARVRDPAPGPTLHWTEPDQTRFLDLLHGTSATVDHAATLNTAAAAIDEYLSRERIDVRPVFAPHPLLDRLRLSHDHMRGLQADDPVAVTVAYAGVAETGSLVLLSDPDTPTCFNFLPEHLICVLEPHNLVRDLDSLWRRIRRDCGGLPRAVNLVTGPSRTADVEQTIQLGAHGPRRLHVILVEGH